MKFAHYVTNVARPEITMKPVESNKVKAVGYDALANTLAVQFAHGTGAIYHYPGVTQKVYEDFIGAESIGKHFGQHLQHLPFDKFVPVKEGEPT